MLPAPRHPLLTTIQHKMIRYVSIHANFKHQYIKHNISAQLLFTIESVNRGGKRERVGWEATLNQGAPPPSFPDTCHVWWVAKYIAPLLYWLNAKLAESIFWLQKIFQLLHLLIQLNKFISVPLPHKQFEPSAKSNQRAQVAFCAVVALTLQTHFESF